MTIAESKKRLRKAIETLNGVQNAMIFEVVETDYSIGFTNRGKTYNSSSYGAFSQTSFFDEYRKKTDAYVNAVLCAELLVAGTKINDPKAYHNLHERP